MLKAKIAVLVSGGGTNLQALIDAQKSGIIKSGNIEKACDFGNKAGSIAVSRMGAQSSMPTIKEILNM